MLGSRFLRYEPEARHGRMYRTLEAGFNGVARAYDVTLLGVLRHPFTDRSIRAGDAGRHGLSVL